MRKVKQIFILPGFKIWSIANYAKSLIKTNANLILLIVGFILLQTGLTELLFAATPAVDPITFDTTEIDNSTCMVYAMLEGPYGALLTATAGFSAVVSAIMGSYQAAYSFLVVGIGCFIARSINSIYFQPVDCSGTNISGYMDTNYYKIPEISPF